MLRHTRVHIFPMILFVLVIVAVGLGKCNSLKTISSNEEYTIFRSQQTPHAIFYHHSGDGSLQSKIATLMNSLSSEEILDSRYMVLALVNCKEDGLDASAIEECKSGRKVYMAYKGEQSQQFELTRLYNEESFLANMLIFVQLHVHMPTDREIDLGEWKIAKQIDFINPIPQLFVHGDNIGLAQSDEDWIYEQNEAKRENKDIVLQYITGMGDTGHYHFMTYYAGHMDEFRYVLSTEPTFAESLGKAPDTPGELWYAKCKGIEDEETACPISQFHGKTDVHGAIENFIKLNGLPLVSMLHENGSSIYGRTEIHIIWMFVDNDENLKEYQSWLPEVVKNLGMKGHYVRSVIVDRRKHEKHLAKFGVYQSTFLPTLYIELAENRYKLSPQLEMFSPDGDITKVNVEKYVEQYLSDPKKEAKKIANAFPIDFISLSEWKYVKPDEKQSELKTLSLGCCKEEQYEEVCKKYGVAFRRLVRTMLMSNLVDVRYYYVDMTGYPNSIETNKIPTVKLSLFEGDSTTEETFKKGNDVLYNDLLKWVNEVFSMDLEPLPVSGSDHVNLINSEGIDVNEVNLLGRDDELEKLEEDEISSDAIKARKKFSKDPVPKLTEKTFNDTIKTNPFVAVLFYVSWDDVSFLFQPVYASILERIDSEATYQNILLRKVDCYAQDFLCHQESINFYPVIRFFKNGYHLADFKGLLDENILMKTIYLYSLPSVVEITTKELTEGNMGPTFIDTTVVGWFSSKDSEFQLFKKISEKFHGKFFFAYCLGEKNRQLLDVPTGKPSIVAFRRNDNARPVLKYEGLFNVHDIERLLDEISLPALGELNAQNFPIYKSLGKPFVLLFVEKEKLLTSAYWSILNELVVDDKLKMYSVVWMDTQNEITRAIRRSYLGQRNMDDIDLVLLNHAMGEVYLHDSKVATTESIITWLKQCAEKKLHPVSRLYQAKWKPLREGFDFLTYIEHGIPPDPDNEYEEEEGDLDIDEDESIVERSRKNENIGNYGHYKPVDRPVFHGVKAPKNIKINMADIDVEDFHKGHDEL